MFISSRISESGSSCFRRLRHKSHCVGVECAVASDSRTTRRHHQTMPVTVHAMLSALRALSPAFDVSDQCKRLTSAHRVSRRRCPVLSMSEVLFTQDEGCRRRVSPETEKPFVGFDRSTTPGGDRSPASALSLGDSVWSSRRHSVPADASAAFTGCWCTVNAAHPTCVLHVGGPDGVIERALPEMLDAAPPAVRRSYLLALSPRTDVPACMGITPADLVGTCGLSVGGDFNGVTTRA